MGVTVFVSEIKRVVNYTHYEKLSHIIEHRLQGFITVARKGQYVYKVYFPRTKFIFLAQTIFSLYKIYNLDTNFIFSVQTLFSLYKH